MEQSGNDIRRLVKEPAVHDEAKAIKIIWNLIQDVANIRIINLIELEKYVRPLFLSR